MTYEVIKQPHHVAMRIVARLAEQVGYLGDLLHIDGPLAFAAYRDLPSNVRNAMPPIEAVEFPEDFDLPLAKWTTAYEPVDHDPLDGRLLDEQHRIWGWCGTAADDGSWQVRAKMEVRKKPDLKAMGRYTSAKSHNTSAGHMKAYDLAIPTVLSREVTWYALGDIDRVRYLLTTHVHALGKKRNLGAGTVLEWIVEPADVETDGVMVEGMLRRRMPIGAADGSPRTGPIRPPYHHPSRITGAVEP